MRVARLAHRFVKHIPEVLDPGVLYVSMEYGTAAHSCCCGCSAEVITPITPTDWAMTFNGEAVSLWPSVGNWTLKCQSHYFIELGKVIEAAPWSDEMIEGARRHERSLKAQHYGKAAVTQAPPVADSGDSTTVGPVSRWLSKWFS